MQNRSEGIMTLTGCSFTGNDVYSNGVVVNAGGELTLIDTLVSGNAGVRRRQLWRPDPRYVYDARGLHHRRKWIANAYRSDGRSVGPRRAWSIVP